MQAFAQLLDTLAFTGSTLAKRRLMAEYFRTRPDPERGLALAALTSELSFTLAKPSLVRELVANRVDPILLNLSRDYVGDMAETVALIWPQKPTTLAQPSLEEVVDTLQKGERREALMGHITQWLDTLDAAARWALLKLITGNIRIGVSARLAKLALADCFGKDVDEIEQIWHGLQPPYITLFAWLENRAEKPNRVVAAYFMPMMLSHPIEDEELQALPVGDYQIELKWDGIRIQLVRAHENVALYSRTGDDISNSFPDMAQAVRDIAEQEFVLDGELLTIEQIPPPAGGRLGGGHEGQEQNSPHPSMVKKRHPDVVFSTIEPPPNGEGIKNIAPFNSLQQRLNRKSVNAGLMAQYPAHVRLYDILIDNGEDVRELPLSERRARLEAWHARHASPLMDLSGIIQHPDHATLEQLRHDARHAPQNGVEGLMIKKLSSPYLAGRPRGHWFKWKRSTLTLDCVLLYAQRGSGKRSSFYSDYTFGVWQEGKLVPIGKAYSGFTDAELVKLDRWIRNNTTNRFGPVREVKQELVLEIEFDSIHPSTRHKSGLAMRFPRVHRIRWDKPAAEADTLENALGMAS